VLLREIHRAPAIGKPPLGASPFSAQPLSSHEPQRVATKTGATFSGARVLNDYWSAYQQGLAQEGAKKNQVNGSMEIRIGLHESLNKSQIELLNAVRRAEIKTFGWPIGILLENRDEYRPRPYTDGIKAEISIFEPGQRNSYDYWSLRVNGDFYLMQSLFENERKPEAIFFNTRIVRITEAILFSSRLYENLGVFSGAQFSLGIGHSGLAGRILTSSSLNRNVVAGVCREERCWTEIVIERGKEGELLVEYVRQIAEPLFLLFDFQTFEKINYEDIVRRFEKGEVT
jgi:hypothetical protein